MLLSPKLQVSLRFFRITYIMFHPKRLLSTFKLRRYISTDAATCSSITRVSIIDDPAGVSGIASAIPRLFPILGAQLQGGAGVRCVVVASASSAAARRAQIVPHFLRRGGGFFPLLSELSDPSPTVLQVEAVVEQARRAGAVQLVVAFGSASVLSIGRAVSSLLSAPNGTRIRDVVSAVGGKNSLVNTAVPFLAVPSCPGGGVETSRESFLLHDGTTLAPLKSLPQSQQACLLDPSLSISLVGTQQLIINFSTLIHSIEAYTRVDSSAAVRNAAWRAVVLSSMSLSRSLMNPKDLNSRSDLLMASALTGASLSSGPLGPSRGIALSIASRYRIPYSSALTALSPDALASVAEFLESKLEEEEEDDDDDDDVEKGGEMKWRDNVGLSTNGQRKTSSSPSWTKKNAFASPSRQTSSSSSSNSNSKSKPPVAHLSEEEIRENALQDRQLEAISKLVKSEAEEEQSLWKEEKDNGGSDIKRTVNRFRHVVYALRTAVNEASSSPSSISSSSSPSPREPSSLSLQHVLSLRADQLGSLTELGPLLKELRAFSRGASQHGALPPTLRDYSLSEKDISEIADAAEVDENTLSSLVTLKHRDIVDLLKRS